MHVYELVHILYPYDVEVRGSFMKDGEGDYSYVI
jgi:hypothetical protein